MHLNYVLQHEIVALNTDLEQLRTEKDQLQQALTNLRTEKDQAVANLTSLARSHARLTTKHDTLQQAHNTLSAGQTQSQVTKAPEGGVSSFTSFHPGQRERGFGKTSTRLNQHVEAGIRKSALRSLAFDLLFKKCTAK